MKDNNGLAKHCICAFEEKWYYGWGAFGQRATTELVNSLIAQYPDVNTKWRSYMLQAVELKTRLSDCYGLVKSYLWWQKDDSIKYNPNEDINTLSAFNSAKEKGSLDTMPDIAGIILYMKGHVGVYVGNEYFVEIMGGGVGASMGQASNGKIIKGSKFTHWFKDKNITYLQEPSIDYVKELTTRNIIKSPEYWENQLDEVSYLKDLFSNIYDYMISKGV